MAAFLRSPGGRNLRWLWMDAGDLVGAQSWAALGGGACPLLEFLFVRSTMPVAKQTAAWRK